MIDILRNKNETAKRREELKTELEGFGDIEITEFSSVTGSGTEELKKIINNRIGV